MTLLPGITGREVWVVKGWRPGWNIDGEDFIVGVYESKDEAKKVLDVHEDAQDYESFFIGGDQ